jgi:uncharacterized protein
MPPGLLAVLLLIASNLFMTVAWYGHLKFKHHPLWVVVLASWGVAFFEYVLQVPANRIGHQVLSTTQLKIIQEAITLVVFVGFARFYFGEVPTWRSLLAFALVFAAVVLVVSEPKKEAEIVVERNEG